MRWAFVVGREGDPAEWEAKPRGVWWAMFALVSVAFIAFVILLLVMGAYWLFSGGQAPRFQPANQDVWLPTVLTCLACWAATLFFTNTFDGQPPIALGMPGFEEPRTWGWFGWGLVASAPVLAINWIPAPPDFAALAANALAYLPTLAAILLISLALALAFETLFRGYLLRGLSARYGVWWGVGITSVMNGLVLTIGAESFREAANNFVSGALLAVALGVLALRTGSLTAPVLLACASSFVVAIEYGLVSGDLSWAAWAESLAAEKELAPEVSTGLWVAFAMVILWRAMAQTPPPPRSELGPDTVSLPQTLPLPDAPPPATNAPR